MISKELKNDFREMIFGTFAAAFEDLIYSWEKKHFLRKWAFPEMSGNHFFQENAPQPPKKQYVCLKKISDSPRHVIYGRSLRSRSKRISKISKIG